jgi:hypothetical protein
MPTLQLHPLHPPQQENNTLLHKFSPASFISSSTTSPFKTYATVNEDHSAATSLHATSLNSPTGRRTLRPSQPTASTRGATANIMGSGTPILNFTMAGNVERQVTAATNAYDWDASPDGCTNYSYYQTLAPMQWAEQECCVDD